MVDRLSGAVGDSVLIVGAQIEDRVSDCRVRAGRIEAIGALPAHPGEDVIDAAGGALTPGFADHHIHLLAAAAASQSVDLTGLGRPEVGRRLAAAVRAATGRATTEGVRAVGWSERAAGDLDAAALDAMTLPGVPVRVAHRSGALWVLNSAALRGLAGGDDPGVERGPNGAPTGRLWRADHLLRGAGAAPDVRALARRLAGYGLTHLTDASPDLDEVALRLLAGGAIPQRLLLLGAPDGWVGSPRVAAGPRKIVVPDHDLPDPDELAARIQASHAAGRAVAVHCVTRSALALIIAAFRSVGSMLGDRIEHLAVAGAEEIRVLAGLRIRVVTQPSLLSRRGDDYVVEVDPGDRDHLWPYASLVRAGLQVACSSDAPYGDLDPWVGIRAAAERRTTAGRVVGIDERVPAAAAFASLLTEPSDPGGRPRQLKVGGPADLMLLHVPREEAIAQPSAELVRLTMCAGVIYAGGEGRHDVP